MIICRGKSYFVTDNTMFARYYLCWKYTGCFEALFQNLFNRLAMNRFVLQRYLVMFLLMLASCRSDGKLSENIETIQPTNIFEYRGTPSSPYDRDALSFSDQGAWFAYGFPTDTNYFSGFSGPFLMTQENGFWCGKSLSRLELFNAEINQKIRWKNSTVIQKAYNSHLSQIIRNKRVKIKQALFFVSGHSACIVTDEVNTSSHVLSLGLKWQGDTFLKGLSFNREENRLVLSSSKSSAKGIIRIYNRQVSDIQVTDSTYSFGLSELELKPGQTRRIIVTHSFIFPQYDLKAELNHLDKVAKNPLLYLRKRIDEKEEQLNRLYDRLDSAWADTVCEGWIPLWAEAATRQQAEAVKNKMMNAAYFNTYLPLTGKGLNARNFSWTAAHYLLLIVGRQKG